ncbi:NAD(P)H-binding protein [Lactobacillus sp. S2-2]|uniref:NAD(P)-dependent oxidoreductase n=1 Tax=Lactobacillus sp. S2-2 TaxID=2692917 RepID=UPI001F30484A|nr:NAD(P)H-binding protein [Lactobacillus sp. S2-2]MCF6515910.1 NAD(P)H-binding protein [Lactobacillus sp. S2-2]
MKYLVLAANGKEGQLVTNEAINRNLDVTVMVRGENKTVAKNVIKKDLFDISYDDLKPFDVVLSCFGSSNFDDHLKITKKLYQLLKNTNKRLIINGGAGSLYVDSKHQQRMMDVNDFPEAYKPIANGMAKALDYLRDCDDFLWTYISPAQLFNATGERKNDYILGGEQQIYNSKGESEISYADFAIAMIDEATKGNHLKQRISVVGI